MVTIKDIARHSSVSTTTVSRILSNDPTLSVSEELVLLYQ
ncbi:LacI family DNA-binding transcriptional regulator [Paenibacillus sp. An7]